MKFMVNDKINGDVIHARGGTYRKDIIYDSEQMKLPDHIVSGLLKMKMGRINFFEEV